MKNDEQKLTNEEEFLFRHIDFKHFEGSTKHREVALFCKELYRQMTRKDKFMFWLNGMYFDPMVRAYGSLLNKKDFPGKTKKEIENYYGSEKRIIMIDLCTEIFSQMNRGYRFMFVIAGQYYVPIRKTYTKIAKNRKKLEAKTAKKKQKAMAKMNREIARKNKRKKK